MRSRPLRRDAANDTSGRTPAACADASQWSSCDRSQSLCSTSQPTTTRACRASSLANQGFENIDGSCSDRPISTAAPAALGIARTAAAISSGTSRYLVNLEPREDRVLVRVGGRAAAEQHERLLARVPQLVRNAGGDHHGVAGAHGRLLRAEPHPALAADEV